MSRPPERCRAAFTFQPCKILAVFFAAIFFAAAAPGQPAIIRSVSGQFVVSPAPEYSRFARRPAVMTNCLRLEPALLAVAAERFKISLWRQLGLNPDDAWSGKIFLDLRAARSPADDVTINIGPFLKVWNYRVELPDVVTRARYARALAAVLLLEIANRENFDAAHSAEIPPWLADGLAQQVLAADGAQVSLSAPEKMSGGIFQTRVDEPRRGLDPLAAARAALQNFPALTFDELCWPSGAQMDGADGGAYLASAQLFTAELLARKDGAEKLRALLAKLPGCMNWQTAFFAAFNDDFKRPLDVEKWWSLCVVRLAARDLGPRWNAEASRARLADLIAVPVEFRADAGSLPQHTVVSLQAVVRNFSPAQRDTVLRIRLRDLELAQFRMAPQFVALTDGYRVALADFLGELKNPRTVTLDKRGQPLHRAAGVAETVKKLDALDIRRRALETQLDASPLPKL